MFKLSHKRGGGGGSSPSRSKSKSSSSSSRSKSKKPHSPTNNHSHANSKENPIPFKKFYPVDSALSLDVMTLATYLQVSSHKNPKVKFYDLVKDTKTFNAFYTLFNKLTGGLNKKLFSYLFFAVVLHCSNNDDYSLKEYDMMFPELGFSEEAKNISKLLHGMSNQVLKEVSESHSHKKTSSSPSRSSSSKTSRVSHSRRVVKTGGNRLKNHTMKYNQTGGFWYIIIAFLMNAGIALGLPMNIGGRGLRIIILICVVLWALLGIWNNVQRILNPDELFNRAVHDELLPRLADGFSAAFTTARSLVPREAHHTFNTDPAIGTFNTTVAQLSDNFRSFTRAENPNVGLSFPELVRVMAGDYEIIPRQQSRLAQFFTGFTQTREYLAIQGHITNAFENVRASFSAIVANTPLRQVPEPAGREPYFAWLLTRFRNLGINLANGQTVADDYAYNYENSRRIAEFVASRSGQALQEAFRRMNYDLHEFITESTARFGVVVERQIFGIRQAFFNLIFASMAIWALL
jgi:hypothetical protein